jgi:hypothetical protein
VWRRLDRGHLDGSDRCNRPAHIRRAYLDVLNDDRPCDHDYVDDDQYDDDNDNHRPSADRREHRLSVES